MNLKNIINKKEILFLETELPNYNLETVIQGEKLEDGFADALEEYYQLKSFDEGYKLTDKGKLAESIIDKLTDAGIW